jgi:hypothetical protein
MNKEKLPVVPIVIGFVIDDIVILPIVATFPFIDIRTV